MSRRIDITSVTEVVAIPFKEAQHRKLGVVDEILVVLDLDWSVVADLECRAVPSRPVSKV